MRSTGRQILAAAATAIGALGLLTFTPDGGGGVGNKYPGFLDGGEAQIGRDHHLPGPVWVWGDDVVH